LKAPLPQIELVPTGGVSLKTAADFIRAGAAALGVGADLVDIKAIREGQAALITERANSLSRSSVKPVVATIKTRISHKRHKNTNDLANSFLRLFVPFCG
jgi:hypothetical protein